jgi:acyl-CoA-binding protein
LLAKELVVWSVINSKDSNIWEAWAGLACGGKGEMGNAYIILVGKPLGKCTLKTEEKLG